MAGPGDDLKAADPGDDGIDETEEAGASASKKKNKRSKKKGVATEVAETHATSAASAAPEVAATPVAAAPVSVASGTAKAADDAEDASDNNDDVSAENAGNKKKKKTKKKGAGGAAEAAEEPAAAQVVKETPGAVKATEELPEAAKADDEIDEDSEKEGEATQESSKKKKKKNKKKGTAAATEDQSVVDAAAAAPSKQPSKNVQASLPEAPAAPAAEVLAKEGAEAASGESEAEDGSDDGADVAAAKKKKKRKKKKGGGGPVVVAGKGVVKYVPDEEFARWVEAALTATTNESEKMSEQEKMMPPVAFRGFRFTGDLRPAFVSRQMKMPPDWGMPDYATEPDGVSQAERKGLREVPIIEGEHLQIMREACRYGREVLDIAARYMVAGVTGDQIDRVVWQACIDRKIYPSPLNYFRFPKAVCVSPNEVICHGIPDCRPIKDGDIINLDVSIYHRGYHADLNETYFVGDCDEEAHRVVRTAYCALHAAANLIRPGTFYRDLGNIIHAEAAKSNCAVVTTYCGHGVGPVFHGPPKVPHYRKNKAVGVMKPGHVFTVEPMINIGGNGGDLTWPDNWTAVTKDGKRSAQFEHTFLVTETGVEALTNRYGTDPTTMPPYDPAMFQL